MLTGAASQQRCRGRVEAQRTLLVALQDRGGDVGGDFAFDGVADGFGFAGVGDGADDGGALHDLADAHGDGLAGHVVEGGEPAFAQLLAAAGVVELDDEVGFFGLEVGGRVVEGEVAVFADADEGDVDGVSAEDVGDAGALAGR